MSGNRFDYKYGMVVQPDIVQLVSQGKEMNKREEWLTAKRKKLNETAILKNIC